MLFWTIKALKTPFLNLGLAKQLRYVLYIGIAYFYLLTFRVLFFEVVEGLTQPLVAKRYLDILGYFYDHFSCGVCILFYFIRISQTLALIVKCISFNIAHIHAFIFLKNYKYFFKLIDVGTSRYIKQDGIMYVQIFLIFILPRDSYQFLNFLSRF